MNFRNRAYKILLSCSMLIGAENTLLAKDCPVDLSYQPIYDNLWLKEADAIQHQFVWQQLLFDSAVSQLQVVKDFTIPLKPVFAGTEADPRSMVYGYHKDGSLDLDGGFKKSYNSNFKKFPLRYHGALEAKYPSGDFLDPVVTQPMTTLFPNTVENIYQHNIPYFAERGFEIQGSDTFKKFSNQFIWTFPAGQGDPVFGLLKPYVALRLVWDDEDSSSKHKSKIPAYVDLHASTNPYAEEYFVLDTYKSSTSKQKNGYGYPTRIPITTDFCRYQKCIDVRPMAFYDAYWHVLTIHVPTTDTDKYFLTSRVVDVGNPDLYVAYTEHLAGFDGSFKVFGRNKSGNLVASSLKKAELFAQVSDFVTIRSRVAQNANVEFFDNALPIRDIIPDFDDSTLFYMGVVANAMNGGSKAFDCYAMPIPDINAHASGIDPVIIPSQEYHGRRCAHGDNPITKLKEHYSMVSSISLWDNPLWNFDGLKLPLDVLKGVVSYPENVATTAVPTNVTAAEDFINVNAHEFTHQAQFASGVIDFLPAEGMAVGIELDTHASGPVFAPLRVRAFTQRLIRTMRGEFTAMTPDSFGLSTYGMGIWWKYLQDQFDYNNQVMRRTMDVLSNKTLGPLLEQNNIPDSYAAVPLNDVGGSAAIDLALGDLFGKNIKDVWNDYSISITLLRNNTSIPPQWRNYFPYWIYNTEYSGFNKILEVTTVYGVEQTANFWQQMDNNDIIPPDYNTPYTGETFIRTLPEHFETDALALRTYAFNVTRPEDGGPESISVTVPAGEWRVTLLQFTSDGTPVGSFIVDGPHALSADGTDSIVFDVAGHSPEFSDTGNIRLVCVNVTFDGTGKQLDEYFTEEVPNASIVIDAPLPPLAS